MRVRAFDDRAAGILALDTQGNVDVCAVRDENGALTGLRAATREEFDQNTMEEPRIRAHWFGMEASAAETYIAPPEVWPLPETEALRADIAAYAPYGLHDESGMIAFMDATVRSFADEAAGYDVLCNPNGVVDVSAVRDESGALTGLRATGGREYGAISSKQWYSEDEPAGALVMEPMYTQEMKNNGLWIDDPDTAGGLNIAENGYADFGITTHQDLLLYDGEYVRYLEDAGANVHYENDGGTHRPLRRARRKRRSDRPARGDGGRIRRQYEAVHGLVNAQMAPRPQTRGLCADMRKRQAPPRGWGHALHTSGMRPHPCPLTLSHPFHSISINVHKSIYARNVPATRATLRASAPFAEPGEEKGERHVLHRRSDPSGRPSSRAALPPP